MTTPETRIDRSAGAVGHRDVPLDCSADEVGLAARLEIRHLLDALARAGDRADENVLRGSRTSEGPVPPDVDQAADRRLSSLHMLGNSVFERSGHDVFVETYFIDFSAHEGAAGIGDDQIGGRHLDLFRRQGGRWRLHRRDIVIDWWQRQPATTAFHELTAKGSILGARGAKDPLYAFAPGTRGRLPDPAASESGAAPAASDRLQARAAICDVIHDHARALDRADAALAASCFHPGARHGPTDAGQSDSLDDTSRVSFHFLSNIFVDFRGSDRAFAESYRLSYRQTVDGRHVTIGGRNLDYFERRGGRWAITHRDTVEDWRDVEPLAGGPPHGFLSGQRGPADPLYRRVADASGPRGAPDAGSSPAYWQHRLDEQKIVDLLYARARSMNRADAELGHACYHPGATESHGPFTGLAADFIDRASVSRPSAASPLRGTYHLISNVGVHFEGADTARVESYHMVWRFAASGDAMIGGRYLDLFEREDGRWAIRHRDVVFDWSRTWPPREPAKTTAPAGQRGPGDILYRYVARGAVPNPGR